MSGAGDLEKAGEVMGRGRRGELALALCADSKFYEGLEVAVCSAVVASAVGSERIRVYVVDGGLTEGEKGRLEDHVARLGERHAVEAVVIWKEYCVDGFEEVNGFKGHRNAYARLFLAELVPEEDWVVWLDADVFCLKDLSGMERYLGPDQAMAGVVDPCFPTLGSEERNLEAINRQGLDLTLPYVNSGVLVLNLRLWREKNVTPQLIAWGVANLGLSRFKDQSVLNWNFAGRVGLLPDEYNVFGHRARMIVEMENEPLCFHAAGKNKFWDLKPRLGLRGAEVSFGELVAAYHYLKFREDELGVDESGRLGRIRAFAKEHPFRRPERGVQRVYSMWMGWYCLLLRPDRYRVWRARKELHAEVGGRARRMLEGMI